MKNSTKILLIVASCLILLGCALAAGAAAFTPGGFPALMRKMEASSCTIGWTASGLGDWENTYSPDNHYNVEENLSSLDIDWTAGTVTLVLYDGDQILFEEQSENPLDADNALRYGIKNETLYIQYCKKGPAFNLPKKDLTVYIPRADTFRSIELDTASAAAYAENLICESFAADTASGNLKLVNISAEKLRFSSSSGKLDGDGIFQDIKANSTSGELRLTLSEEALRCACSTTSGKIHVSGSFREFSAESTSGDIDAQIHAEQADFDTISGKLTISGAIGDLEAESVSGQVEFTASGNAPQTLDISTTSGAVALTLPENAGFTMDFDTVSGNFDSDIAISLQKNRYICGDGSGNYEIETVSGSLRVYDLR